MGKSKESQVFSSNFPNNNIQVQTPLDHAAVIPFSKVMQINPTTAKDLVKRPEETGTNVAISTVKQLLC